MNKSAGYTPEEIDRFKRVIIAHLKIRLRMNLESVKTVLAGSLSQGKNDPIVKRLLQELIDSGLIASGQRKCEGTLHFFFPDSKQNGQTAPTPAFSSKDAKAFKRWNPEVVDCRIREAVRSFIKEQRTFTMLQLCARADVDRGQLYKEGHQDLKKYALNVSKQLKKNTERADRSRRKTA